MIEEIAEYIGVKTTDISLRVIRGEKSVLVNGEDRTEEVKHLLDPQEKLRQEFDQKLEQRVNQIAEAVASGARGQELADKMRRK